MNRDPDHLNPFTLHFADAALEQAFREERARKMVRPIRVSVLLVIAMVPLFWILLPQIFPEFRNARAQFAVPTIAFLCAMVWTYVRSYLPSFLRRQQFILAVLFVGVSIWTVGFVSKLPGATIDTLGMGLFLIHTLNGYSIFRFRISVACFACWSSALIYLGYLGYTGALVWPELPSHAGGLFLANIFGMIAGYQFDQGVRREFLALRLLGQERERSERLLLNVLPAAIADRLKASSDSIADHSTEVTVLFADIVGFTALSAKKSPLDLVRLLDLIFSEFDALAEKHGLEKIKTIGDAYMAAAGLPTPCTDHAIAATNMAQDMLASVARIAAQTGEPLTLRIGLNSGPVVAGVIGRKKFIYDLWGDTVNTASRLEAASEVNRLNISAHTHELVRNHFVCEYRGKIAAKGKGDIDAFFLETRKQDPRFSVKFMERQEQLRLQIELLKPEPVHLQIVFS